MGKYMEIKLYLDENVLKEIADKDRPLNGIATYKFGGFWFKQSSQKGRENFYSTYLKSMTSHIDNETENLLELLRDEKYEIGVNYL